MIHLGIDYAQVAIFLAILLRLSLVLFMLPFFGGNDLPKPVKGLMALALAIVVYLALHGQVTPLSLQPLSLVSVVVAETLFGSIIALAVLTIFGAFEFAGEVISFQMGFGFAQAADPQTGTQITVISQWFQLMATLVFFSLNGHHALLTALIESFKTVPVGGFTLTTATFDKIIFLSGKLFVIGLKVAAPVMAIFFLAQVGFGLVARFSPEVNILMLSFPLTILLGFFFISLFTSIWGDVMTHFFQFVFQIVRNLSNG